MRVVIGIYLVLFAAAGAWSVVPKDPAIPFHERVVEGIAFGILSFGVLWYLLERPVPGGSIAWLAITSVACLAELVVIVKDRRRERRAEILRGESAEEIQRLFQLNDLAVGLFFLPAIVVNVRYGVG